MENIVLNKRLEKELDVVRDCLKNNKPYHGEQITVGIVNEFEILSKNLSYGKAVKVGSDADMKFLCKVGVKPVDVGFLLTTFVPELTDVNKKRYVESLVSDIADMRVAKSMELNLDLNSPIMRKVRNDTTAVSLDAIDKLAEKLGPTQGETKLDDANTFSNFMYMCRFDSEDIAKFRQYCYTANYFANQKAKEPAANDGVVTVAMLKKQLEGLPDNTVVSCTDKNGIEFPFEVVNNVKNGGSVDLTLGAEIIRAELTENKVEFVNPYRKLEGCYFDSNDERSSVEEFGLTGEEADKLAVLVTNKSLLNSVTQAVEDAVENLNCGVTEEEAKALDFQKVLEEYVPFDENGKEKYLDFMWDKVAESVEKQVLQLRQQAKGLEAGNER